MEGLMRWDTFHVNPTFEPQQSSHQPSRGRGDRSGNRRAGAESEHVVIRGRDKGKSIVTTVVHHPDDTTTARLEDTILSDPPDKATDLPDMAEPPDEAMAEAQ
nr:uncharacterized protein LOC109179535 isoform X2 [Ipomoea batatas]